MTGKGRIIYSSIKAIATVSERFGVSNYELIGINGSAAADAYTNCRFFAMNVEDAYAEEAGRQYAAAETENVKIQIRSKGPK